MLQDIAGFVVAFACALGAIYLDCYQAMRVQAPRVPGQFWRSIGLACLAIGCGLLSVGAFAISLAGENGFLQTVLGAAVPNHAVRGFYTGLAVLTLIRSKIFQVRDADVGLEYIYREARSACLRSINLSWISWRGTWINKHLAAIIERMAQDSTFDDQLRDLVAAAVANAEEKTKTNVNSQLAEIMGSRPDSPPTISDRAWSKHGRALAGLVLDNCGPRPIERLLQNT